MRPIVEEISGAFDGVSGGDFVPEIRVTVHGQFIESHAHQPAQIFTGFFLRIGGYIHREVDMLSDAAPARVRTGKILTGGEGVRTQHPRAFYAVESKMKAKVFKESMHRMRHFDRSAAEEGHIHLLTGSPDPIGVGAVLHRSIQSELRNDARTTVHV